jgi:hypothetical protein
MLNGYKSPLKSLGVLGGAGGVLVGLAGLVGVTVSPDDVSQARDLVISAVTLVSGAVALYGRIRARNRITLNG